MAQGDPALIHIFILILILFIISSIILQKILTKYKERKSNITLYLGFSLFSIIKSGYFIQEVFGIKIDGILKKIKIIWAFAERNN